MPTTGAKLDFASNERGWYERREFNYPWIEIFEDYYVEENYYHELEKARGAVTVADLAHKWVIDKSPLHSKQREFRDNLLNQLREAYAMASHENWDGYGGLPVPEEVYEMARKFIGVLPSAYPAPEISPDPDGEIAFDWYIAPRQVFNITVGSAELLLYATLSGNSKSYGREQFQGTMPLVLQMHLERLYEADAF